MFDIIKNMYDTKFKACIIPTSDFNEVLQNIYDDSSLHLDQTCYPYAEAYSKGYDCGYDHDEIVGRLQKYFQSEIVHLCIDKNSTVVVFKSSEPKQFSVETPVGTLIAYEKGSLDEYPGIYVDYIPKGSDDIEPYNGDCVACVEYETTYNRLQTVVYTADSDAPIDDPFVYETNLARIDETDDGMKHYFDKNGDEILHGMAIRFDDGTEELVYRTENDELGIDATNKTLIEKGMASPCEYGIYPLTEFDLAEIQIVQ